MSSRLSRAEIAYVALCLLALAVVATGAEPMASGASAALLVLMGPMSFGPFLIAGLVAGGIASPVLAGAVMVAAVVLCAIGNIALVRVLRTAGSTCRLRHAARRFG